MSKTPEQLRAWAHKRRDIRSRKQLYNRTERAFIRQFKIGAAVMPQEPERPTINRCRSIALVPTVVLAFIACYTLLAWWLS